MMEVEGVWLFLCFLIGLCGFEYYIGVVDVGFDEIVGVIDGVIYVGFCG